MKLDYYYYSSFYTGDSSIMSLREKIRCPIRYGYRNNNNFSSLFHLDHQVTAKYGPTHTGYEDYFISLLTTVKFCFLFKLVH